MDVLRRTKALEVIDHACGQHVLSEVSTSECVAVLLSGVFVGAHSLWRVRERLDPYDMVTVMQDPTFDLSRFPEERLAKSLDDLWAAGPDKLMTGIALQVIKAFELDTSFLHFDTTSLSFNGAHEREDLWRGGDGDQPPVICHGYSKAKRPDLKQVLFGCLSANEGIPLLGKVMDGNQADNVAAAEFFARVRELVVDPREVCLVADCKGWDSTTLEVVERHGLRLLSRLPRNTLLHRKILAMASGTEQVLERPAKRRGQAPERYEFTGFDEQQTIQCKETGADGTITTQERIIPVRVVRVFSSVLLKKKIHTLDHVRASERRRAEGLIRDWHAVAYACESDAKRAAERHVSQYVAITHELVAEVVRHEGPVKRGRGRPRRRPEPALAAAEHWRVRYRTNPLSTEVSAARLRHQATFVLIRTRRDDWTISDAEMINRYRAQYHIEHGFAWLKSGAEINPMFIHTPHRIAAMGFIYCLGLMVWNLIQRTVRQHLKSTGTGLPYHRGKLSANITTRFLFELFPMVQTITMTMDDGRVKKQTLGLDHWQQKALQALGTPITAFKPVMPKI
jgi:transposase